MVNDEQRTAARDELLNLVVRNAPSIVFGLQRYGFEMRSCGELDEANKLLKLATDINKLFYQV